MNVVRYGLSGTFVVAGVVVLIVASGSIGEIAGLVLIGNSLVVLFVSVLAELMVSSQDDREREQRARETFVRTGRWPSSRRHSGRRR